MTLATKIAVMKDGEVQQRPAVGSQANFAVDTAKACLFDPATESRIS
jgi:ABC-type sugar transport system ATPase subunit